MTRRVAFTKADLERALKGAKSAGVNVARVEICRDGKLIFVIGEPESKTGLHIEVNEWDEAV